MPITGVAVAAVDPVASLVAALNSATSALTSATSASLQKTANLSDLASAGTARTNLGLGTAATQASTAFDATGAAAAVQSASLQKTANLSDLSAASTARTNLGLGAAAVMSTAQIAADSALTGVFASGAIVPTRQRAPQMSVSSPGSNWQSGHGWTSAGSAGTWSLNDTSDFVIGSQCVSVALDGTQNNSMWFQKFNGTAVDMTTHDLILWVKATPLANLRKIIVFASSDNLVNYVSGSIYDFTYGLPPGGHLRDNEWFPLRFNLSDIASATGSVVKTAITGFRISPQDNSAVCTVKFGGLATYPRPTAAFPNGVVTLGFDDSFASHRTRAAPYLAKYGYQGTAYTICDVIGGGGSFITLAQLRELRDVYGWELAAHAYSLVNHDISFTDLSAADLSTEVNQMVVWLQNNGVLTGSHFAYPRGRHSSATDAVISKYFSTGRTLQSLPLEVQQPGSPMRTRSVQISTGGTSTATAAIDKAYLNGNWLQLVFHDVAASGATGNSINLSELQTIVDYCNTKGIAVAPASDVWRAAA